MTLPPAVPLPVDQPLLDLLLPPDPTSPRVARAAVTPVLAERLPPDALDRLVLLVSELVTNAVRHACTPAELRIWINDQLVLVKVCDGSPAAPQVRLQAPDATSGRGMFLVQRLATRWGIEAKDPGKCVWFELPTSPRLDAEDGDFHFDIDAADPL